MEIPSFLDEEIIYSIGYWFLVAGTEFALIAGFKLSKYWGSGSIGWLNMLLTLLLIPVAAYFVIMYTTR